MKQTSTYVPSMPLAQVSQFLAGQAVDALVQEARLPGKPGLVGPDGTGAHKDMNLALMLRSAHALAQGFHQMAVVSFKQDITPQLRCELGRIGRETEQTMLAVTNGINTHKGAIWALGLLVAATASCYPFFSIEVVLSQAGALASIDDPFRPSAATNGQKAEQQYGCRGARGEAEEGFPSVQTIALPALDRARAAGATQDQAALQALLALIAEVEDTCLIHRGGLEALYSAQEQARATLDKGGACQLEGQLAIRRMQAHFLQKNLSPGGSADLLAACLFLDGLSRLHAAGNFA